MVSNAIRITVQELVRTLARFRDEFADDPEYQELRKPFPNDWPM